MKNEIQLFKNKEFGEIRSLVIDNEPWFVGKDVAEALGYKDVNHAILDHVDKEDKVNSKTQGQNAPELGQRGSWLINESGLYSLILSSKLSNAKKFKRWVTSEVLPQLRKTGQYSLQKQIPTTYKEALIELVAQIEENEKLQLENKIQDQQIKEMKPKVSYYDIILQNKALITITSIAKDYGMTAREMNKELNKLKIQYKLGQQWFLYKDYQNNGYTSSETFSVDLGNGNSTIKMQTKWTQKGRLFLYDLLKKHNILPLIERGLNEAETKYN